MPGRPRPSVRDGTRSGGCRRRPKGATMRRLLVLGGGTAGTMVVNKLRRVLDRSAWGITVVDQDDAHLYQPGLLFVPFGGYRPDEIIKPRSRFIPDGVDLVLAEIDRVDAAGNRV